MKFFTNQNRTNKEFEVGNWVYLRLRPYRQMTVALRKNLKLSPQYFGPFQVIQKVGKVAYKLDLPLESHIYPKFHVSNLKKKLGSNSEPSPGLHIITTEGTLTPEPEKILLRRMKKRGNRVEVEVLTQCKGTTEEEATWEDFYELKRKFPDHLGKVL